MLDVNKNQTAITTGDKVDTVLLTAGKADKDGKAVTIKDFTTHTATKTIVVGGANDLVITTLTGEGDEVISATTHTGKLTISDFTKNTKVFSGSNDDTFKVTTGASEALEITSGAGNDTIVGFTAEKDKIKTSNTAGTDAEGFLNKGTLDKATYATLDLAIASFAAGGANATTALNAYQFKYDSKDYLLIDNGTDGYDAATDSVVEIVGLVGTLDAADILNA